MNTYVLELAAVPLRLTKLPTCACPPPFLIFVILKMSLLIELMKINGKTVDKEGNVGGAEQM